MFCIKHCFLILLCHEWDYRLQNRLILYKTCTWKSVCLMFISCKACVKQWSFRSSYMHVWPDINLLCCLETFNVHIKKQCNMRWKLFMLCFMSQWLILRLFKINHIRIKTGELGTTRKQSEQTFVYHQSRPETEGWGLDIQTEIWGHLFFFLLTNFHSLVCSFNTYKYNKMNFKLAKTIFCYICRNYPATIYENVSQ